MLGVTLLVFAVTRFVPGGPIDRALQEAVLSGGNQKSASDNNQGGLSEEQLEELEEEYGYDKPILVAYFQWLGVAPRENFISKGEFEPRASDTVGNSLITDPDNETLVLLKDSGRLAKIVREGDRVKEAVYVDTKKPIAIDSWKVRLESPDGRRNRWVDRYNEDLEKAPDNYAYRAVAYKSYLAGLFQGNLGRSSSYGDSVSSLILARIPIALYFGILTTIITYGICIPLGIVKAIKHRTFIDNATSIIIFIGYAIPGFALGAILLVYTGARWGWFPLFGLVSPGFDELSFGAKLTDLAHHTLLPLLCYVIGGFAFTTMMMKNNLMDNLAADYVRTAVAKGVSFKTAVFRHAFRNSFIPIASGLGGLVGIIVSGSMLVEKVFDIQGFGLLQFQAVIGRDQTLIMGTLAISAFLLVLGNILSDIIVAFVDPRVKFN